MVENVGRKVVWIAVLLLAAILLLIVPERPFPLGLDLAGGTRLVYRLDIEEGRRSGAISDQESDDEVMNEQVSIIEQRVNPTGVRESIVRRIGSDRIEIGLPDSTEARTSSAVRPLASAVDAATNAAIELAGTPAELAAFPSGGGMLEIEGEYIRYRERSGSRLDGITRGEQGTASSAHEAGKSVVLISDDAIKNAIENLGDLRFFGVARPTDFAALGTDETSERNKLTTWLNDPANAEVPSAVFNALDPERGGPSKGLVWMPMRQSENETRLPLAQRQFLPLLVPAPEETFTGASLAKVSEGQDEYGRPAVAFSMREENANAFGKFTEKFLDQSMAIALNGEVITAPNIEEPLYRDAIIKGQFSQREVNEMVTVLRSGSLRIRPQLVNEERVGASLGDQNVTRNLWAGAIALGLLFAFMAGYYRRLGWYANSALVVNLVLLMGAMALLKATLTLPGIAGIVLTIGMAVDANILIFDRIREEAEKGLKPIQAAKEGFAHALSAIVDSNVTTLLTALILYNVGTGPIRGFAVTLSVGILTSMFAALVVTRVLVHFHLARGEKRFQMARWWADAKFRFMDKTRVAWICSTLFCVGGLVLFYVLPAKKKLGIDFLGGASAKIRSESALTIDAVRGRVRQLPGEFAQADVVSLPASEEGDGTFREFRITAKGAGLDDSGGEENLERVLRAQLVDVLQKGPIEADVAADGGVHGSLYFESAHGAEDVQKALAGTGLADLSVTARDEFRKIFEITGKASTGVDGSVLRNQLQTALVGKIDSGGRALRLANPVPETSVIGGQVVGELRDSAIKAIVLSLILTVIYIRIRFAEYSYGIAAVIAVVHDVLTTVTALAILIWIPWIQVEMNLTMIAAFLTIIGYSINDTIIVFDRIRENRPKFKQSLSEIVDLSINQTLSRTVCTTLTTTVAALVLLIMNFGTGGAVEGFAFALTWGIFTGTYSTIMVACPVFVMLEERHQQRLAAEKSVTAGTPKAAPHSA
jgi:SecD/SecF fusion protein